MKRILNSKITFSDPYMIRAIIQGAHSYLPGGVTEGIPFYPTLQRAKKLYTGATWAYSNPDHETIYLPLPEDLNGFSPMYRPMKSVYASYWAFKDEQDALQFMLTFGGHASRVYMWSDRLRFTVIEQDE